MRHELQTDFQRSFSISRSDKVRLVIYNNYSFLQHRWLVYAWWGPLLGSLTALNAFPQEERMTIKSGSDRCKKKERKSHMCRLRIRNKTREICAQQLFSMFRNIIFIHEVSSTKRVKKIIITT